MDTNIISGIISASATLLTGFVAWRVYLSQKNDNKIQAARVLLTEIRIAEEKIDQLKNILDTESITDLPSIFPTKNWKNYSHLFISDFDQDDLKLINSFYEYGEIIEEFAKRNNNYFWITTEERAKVTVRTVAKIIEKTLNLKGKNPDDEVKQKRDYLIKGLDLYNSPYVPIKTMDEIKKYLPKIPKITTSSCGLKLKKIAKLSK